MTVIKAINITIKINIINNLLDNKLKIITRIKYIAIIIITLD